MCSKVALASDAVAGPEALDPKRETSDAYSYGSRGAAGADRSRHFADPPPIYLRHTYATFALRAGVSIFDLSRFMGASLTMIDRHYGHLARDGRQHAVALLDALAATAARGRSVDVATGIGNPLSYSIEFVTLDGV